MISRLLALILVLSITMGASTGDTNVTGTFPLAVSNGVLVTALGEPFMLIGDSPHSMIGKVPVGTFGDTLPTPTMAAYLADRQAQGYNTIMVEMLCSTYTQCSGNAQTPDGISPFTGKLSSCSTDGTNVEVCYDLATPNPAYFGRVDTMINLAARYNIQVMLIPFDTAACSSTGWMQTVVNNGPSKLNNFATFLGNRYKSFPNIIWQWGNDYQCYQTTTTDDLVFGFMTALRTTDPDHLLTMQASYNISTSLDNTTNGNNWKQLLSLNGVYTYYPLYDEVYHARDQALSVPPFVSETNYEAENDTGCDPPNDLRQRREYWWAMTSGSSAGYINGTKYWNFQTGWNTNLDTTSTSQLNYMHKLLISLAWNNLVPDTSHRLVTAGFGTYANPPVTSGSPGNPPCPAVGSTISTNDYVSAAQTTDGSLALAYLPVSAGPITVAMNKIGANATVRWYDPTKDPALETSFTVICSPTGTPCGSDTQNMSPPGAKHYDGSNDWVVLLQAPGH